jgi:hypothetical protein
MEIIQRVGPDNPVILVREPKLVARNLKQLQSMDGEDELFLQPQLILALYSSQIHLKQGETISFADLFAFDDDTTYILINTNIDQNHVSEQQRQQHRFVRSKSQNSCHGTTDFESSFEADPSSEVPTWLLSEFGRNESIETCDERIELAACMDTQPISGHNIIMTRTRRRGLCCCIL